MNGMKKGIAALVMGTLALSSLTGCGQTSQATSNGDSSQGSESNPEQITFYSGGDTNVQELWQKDLIPKFEAENKGIKVRLVFLTHGSGADSIYQKIEAAKKSNQKSV